MSERYVAEILKDDPAWLYMLDDAGQDDLGVDLIKGLVGPPGSHSVVSNVTRGQAVPIPGAVPGLGCRFTRAGGESNTIISTIDTGAKLGGGDFTVACWMDRHTGAGSSRHNLWGKKQSGEVNIGFSLNVAGHVLARLNQCTPQDITIDTSPGGWKHYAFTVIGTTVQPYLNGVAGTPVVLTVKSFAGEVNDIDIKGHSSTAAIDFSMHALVGYTTGLSASRIAEHYRSAVQLLRLARGRPWSRTNFTRTKL